MSTPKESPTKLEDRIRNKAERLDKDLRASVDKSLDFVKENPLLALLGAFALGFVVAKATSSSRKRP